MSAIRMITRRSGAGPRRAIFYIFAIITSLFCSPAQAADREKLLIYSLLGLDQRSLFPESEYNPLSELEAWSDLYAESRAAAAADDSDDRRAIKTFMLIGWIARAKNDFATIEVFTSDFKKLFDFRSEGLLKAMTQSDFLVGDMCAYLADSFALANAEEADRERFIDLHQERIKEVLGADRQKKCLDAFWQVKS